MRKTRKYLIAFLVTVLLVSSLFAGIAISSRSQTNSEMEMDAEVYNTAENTLKSFLGLEDNSNAGGREYSGDRDTSDPYVGTGRMTQRVTVKNENGILPISGTVTKLQDAYYPGTYELKFSNRAILTSIASVQVIMDVEPGEQVYILTGSKETGNKQVDVVEVDTDKLVVFDTAIIQDYTLSKTDIIGAQAAVASVMGD